MRLGKVKLIGGGPHKNLEVDLNGTVVGLMGPNGSGKSSLLEFIEFAFAGEFSAQGENVGSFVNDDPSITEAVFELELHKQAHVGSITRTIKKKSGNTTRKLIWDGGDPVTTDKDAQDLINQHIFQADAKAVISSCFIPQGKLIALLFGTQTEREKLFSRLLMLSDIENAGTEVGKRMADLRAGVADLTLLLDESQSAVVFTSTELEKAELELNALGRESEFLAKKAELNVTARVVNAATTSRARMMANDGVLTDVKAGLTSVVQDMLNSFQATPDSVDIIASVIADRYAEVGRSSLVLRILKAAARLKELDIPERKASSSYDKAIKDLQSKRLADASALSTATQSKAYLAAHEQAVKDVARLEQEAVSQRLEVANAEEALGATKMECDVAKDDLSGDAKLLQILKDMDGSVEGTCCPVCASESYSVDKVREGIIVQQAKFDASETLASVLSAKERVLSHTMDQVTNGLRDTERQLVRHRAAMMDDDTLAVCRESVASIEALYAAVDKAGVELEALEKSRGGCLAVEREITILESQITNNPITEVERKHDIKGLQIFVDTTMNDELATLKKDLEHIRRLISKHEELTSQLERAQVNLSDSAEAYRKATIELETTGAVDISLDTIKVQQDEVNIRLSAFQEAKGLVVERKKSQQMAVVKFSELETRVEQNRKKETLYADLDRVKTLCSRKGLSLMFMKSIFNDVTDGVNNMLQHMSAVFRVRASEEEPVTFEYVRDDIEGEEDRWRHQNKLSGAQRVLLSLAFVMAVQQLVLPGLSFLVLDEPTTHMDKTAVQGLNQFLSNISSIMRNTDFQIIVCDHHDELVAFDKIIRFPITTNGGNK